MMAFRNLWIISSGRARSNPEEHQEDTAYTWQQQTFRSHVSKRNRECQLQLCIFRLEVHIGISITSIKTASDRPENGVFIAELIPNSVAHNAGLKVKILLTLCDKHISCFVAHRLSVLLFRNAVHCTVDWRWNYWCEWAKPYWKDTQWGMETVEISAI